LFFFQFEKRFCMKRMMHGASTRSFPQNFLAAGPLRRLRRARAA
jgi:hypothetical protein